MNEEKKENIFFKIKKVKHIEIIVAVIAIVIMLIIYFSSFFKSSKENETTQSNSFSVSADYCTRMKEEITQMVSNIEGAGRAVVVINWQSSVELILANNENTSQSSNSSSPVLISSQGSNQPIVLKEIYPKALGVVVVCEGGSDARVKLYITMGISTLLQITSDNIAVYAMNKK